MILHRRAQEFLKTPQGRLSALGVFFAALIALYWDYSLSSNQTDITKPQKARPAPQDFLSQKHTLVPIPISNQKAIDSTFQHDGIVDLYIIHPDEPGEMHHFASNIIMVRAPLNPQQFLVEVPIAKAPPILKQTSGFHVTLRSWTDSATPVFHPLPPPRQPRKKVRSRIRIETQGRFSNFANEESLATP